MKLLRVGERGRERPAILDREGRRRDASSLVEDWSGPFLSDDSVSRLRGVNIESLPILSDEARVGPCVARVGKFICIGLNYADHAAESGVEAPSEPVVFFKATSAIVGPNDEIQIPRGSRKTDWEVELGVVIGREAKYVGEAEALQHVAGYCVVHDVSERAFQLEGTGQWVKGKSADTFGPIGPYLVTRDEVDDPGALDLWLEVNGERMQVGNTATMIFSVAFIVSYLSRFMRLEPGDVISTGTPPGVGMGMKPPRFLKPGDKVRLGVEGLGAQAQTCIASP